MHPLILSTQRLSGANRARIGDIAPIRLHNDGVIACMRQGGNVVGYRYIAATETWALDWKELVFPQEKGNYPLDRYPWLMADKLVPNENIILLRHPDGIQFYQLDPTKPGLQLLAKDRKFHKAHDMSLVWGHFYPDRKYVGVMTRDISQEIEFYASTLEPNEPPFSPLEINVSFPSWRASETEFFATRLHHNDSEVIGLRTNQGLEFYQFNTDYVLEKVISTSQITKSRLNSSTQDHLFFGDLTHQMYQDILHLNQSGLFVYQYNPSQKDYRWLHRHAGFTQPYGWVPDYANSIRLIDLNGDRRDDLVFTGLEGITALSFDATTKSWKTLLQRLSGAERYATVVGALPPMLPTLPYPSLFMQDTEGNVQSAKVIPAPITTTTARPPTTTSIATTIAPSPDRDVVVPKQMIRTNLPEKPTLRWAEQWDDGFLKETVEPASGQARFSIPLIDIFAATGWKVELALSYHSQRRTADLLGVGWSLPLAQDYIFVDHQGSIYPEDARYYLMTEGRPQPLKWIGTDANLQRFQLADTDLPITYHPSKQHWIIEGKTEQVMYGKPSDTSEQDALQWSLGWPNWRGLGRDKAAQQPLVTGWYLSRRRDKDNQRTLYYHYEKDHATIPNGKKYDTSLRLKTIHDDQYMKLNVDYAPKNSSEYTPPNPVDKEGNIIFPIPLDQSHYLQGYSLTTATYSQTLQFSYHVTDGKRFLTAIQQPSAAHTEPLLQFSYQTVLDTPTLQSCTLLPKGSTVHFNHQSITPPESTIVHTYPIREKATITYGSDYAIMAYRDLNPTAGKVILRIMNRAMTQTIIDCSVDAALSCPSAESDIKDYAIQAYADSFVVFTESSKKRTLHRFHRHEQTWSTAPTTYTFGKQALVRFSETIIAAAEPDEPTIMLFTRADNQSDWHEQTLTLPRAITALTLHNRLIVGYDDQQLWLFHHNNQAGWKRKFLDHQSNRIDHTLALFDIESETRQKLATALKQNNLQILNNCILFNTLQENHGQLSSHTHLFLLDAQYNIAKKQSFKIERKNIYQINHESTSKDGNIVYHLGYVKEKGLFKVRVKNVSGKAIEDIKNRNRKADQIQELKETTNKDSDFQHMTRQYVLSDLNIHIATQFSAQMSQQGVYVGNDTLLRITGTGWEKDSLPTTLQKTNRLGKYFVLEAVGEDQSVFKLYKQDSNQNKQGPLLKNLELHAPGQIINQYPAYIAYHPKHKPNLVQVLTFKDEQTLGELYTFHDEQLLPGSDWQNLITAKNGSSTTMGHAEPEECWVRAVATLLPPKVQSFVNQVTLTAGDTQRITAYERSLHAEGLTYSETVTIIPGNKKNQYGWHQAARSYHKGNVTTTEKWFNADGESVLVPPESPEKPIPAIDATPNPMLLLDRSGKWLVSDFSPYSLADEMVAYYGFEPYESNQIGRANTTDNAWKINKAQILKGNFAFTGEHYLQLNSTTQPSFLEGVLQPRNQETTYLAACWLRGSTIVDTNPLKAILHTSHGQKIIRLQAQVKQKQRDWYYLELPLNFQVLRQIYRDYFDYHAISNSTLPLPTEALFQITLRVEAPANQIIDLDHIRFSPLTHDFQAAIYNPWIGKPTAIIQANGLVTRTIYNHLQQEIASTDETGQLQEFSSSSRTGKLFPIPQGSRVDAKPNVITFEPDYGFYETFDTTAWHNRWKLDHPAAWHAATGQLWHKHSENHRIEAREDLFDGTSAAIRYYFALQEPQATLSLHWQPIGRVQFTRQSDHATRMVLPNGQSITKLPSAGELIAMLEENYLWLWLDGVLLVDQPFTIDKSSTITSLTPWASFALDAKGAVLVEDCLVMNRPQVTVQYYNAWSQKTQVIQLEDGQTVQVNEVLYDELGREAITTKTTRIKRKDGQALLAYRPDFVRNKNPTDPQSVWHTGILQGEVNQCNPADQGVAYTRTKYAPNPLNQLQIVGLPGKDFAITGRYATKISHHSDVAFMDNLFPIHQGYHQKVEHTPNGSLHIAVLDSSNNEIAKYVRVPSYNHLLTTYEYDAENRLIKILPPLYHEKVDTATRLTPWQFAQQHLSAKEKEWQKALATRFIYDRHGHLIRKITPDSGTTAYLYNAAGQKRFMVDLDENEQSKKIVYFNYDENNQLITTGNINRPLSLTTLYQHLESNHIPYAQPYQTFDHADGQIDPLLRGRDKQYITHNDDEVIIEKLRFDGQQQVISKKAISTQTDPLTNIEKQYVYGKLHQLRYPITVDGQPFDLVHTYNRLGQLIGLGTADNPTYYARFGYHATGQLAHEQYQPATSHNFTRNYQYNAPGFLERIADPFLTEEIAYTHKGYGQSGYGDGMVMQATFNASWPLHADGRWFQIGENDLGDNHSTLCIKALKRTGYLTDNGQPIKLYFREAETALPLVCGGETGRNMATLVAKKQKPTYYGHRYAYGNHQELVKAKYITDTSDHQPLQPDSFAKHIPAVNPQQSEHIWKLLTDAGYIITDQQRNDPATSVGKRGTTFFRHTDLQYDLAALNDGYTLYGKPIERLMLSAIGQQRTVSRTDFENAFLHWQGVDLNSSIFIYNSHKDIAREIGQMLLDKGYLPTKTADFTSPLNKNFTTTLLPYTALIPQIVATLAHHCAHELGQTAFDMEAYKIDANGNHHLFYTGFNRYALTYRNKTNQIENITLNWPIELNAPQGEKVFAMKHDEQGNVIQALHKNIQHIEYHPVSQRTTSIKLTDGRTLRFYYDTQGERVLKRVFDGTNTITHETKYLRDEQGRVLMDRQTTYLDGSTQQIVTAYLYGPRGILGFIRNNSFYSITTDHAGSVRLVMKEGKVVAAYDYLPYGGIMRSYGNDPQAHIIYRYTGQEWDEETGLYNYHARLYDPTIGRFYQIDPKAQYMSPYVYAGNSPISVVDPDGEFAFLLTCIILGAIAGAYLGGAAANNRWNPADWDFKDSGTWLGIGGGGIAGGLLPLGFGASVGAIGGLVGTAAVGAGVLGTTLTATGMTIGVGATIGLGIGGAYLTTAAASGSWNPAQWKWDRPDVWSALFQGFSGGSGIAGGVAIAHNFANTGKAIMFLGNLKALNAIGIGQRAVKGIFLTISYTAGGGVAYARAGATNNNYAFWEWDWTNPATWSGLVDGFDTGMGWPQNIIEMGRGIGKLAKNPKNPKKYLFSGQKNSKLQSVLKNSNHPLYKTTTSVVMTSVVMAYFMGSSANGDFDITKWNFAVFSTYEGVLNGVFFGKDITKTLKYIRKFKVQESSNELVHVPKNKPLDLSIGFSRILDSIQTSRIGEKFQHLFLKAFAESAIWLSKLNDQSPAIRSQAENFLREGVRKWESGKNRPPQELQRLIAEEAKLKVQEDSDLTIWKTESEEALRKQQEVFPDEEDSAFLNCKRAKRRKRTDGTRSCVIGLNNVHSKADELSELLLDTTESRTQQTSTDTDDSGYRAIAPKSTVHPDGFDPTSPSGFAEHFSLLLNRTPNILAAAKPEFIYNLILGSLSTFSNRNFKIGNVYTNVETVKIPPHREESQRIKNINPSSSKNNEIPHQMLKTFFKKDENTLVLKTFIAEERVLTSDMHKDQKEIMHEHYKKKLTEKSAYSNDNLDKILMELGIKDLIKIEESIFYIKPDHTLLLKQSRLDNYTPNNHNHPESIGYKKIEFENQNERIDLDKNLSKISSQDINDVKQGIENFSKGILKIYLENQEKFGFNQESESALHAFFYGALSFNFKYRYDLDVYVERIAGRGYADLMLLSRRDQNNNKNWNAIPIIIEFKADQTSVSDATNQVTNTGYLYNLSMRTVAEKAIIVGINSNTGSKIQRSITTNQIDIPQYQGFTHQLIAKARGGSNQIESELQHLYYSISPLAIKGDDHYLSCLILGEILSTQNAKIYARKDRTLSTFILKKESKWIMLNIIESSKPSKKGAPDKYTFQDVMIDDKIKLPNNNDFEYSTSNFIRIDIKVNPKSKAGWSPSEQKRTTNQNTNAAEYYFQGIEEKDIIHNGNNAKYQEIPSMNMQDFLSNPEVTMNTLSSSLIPIKDFINSESDFQAVLHGLFLGIDKKQSEIIKVFPEANPSVDGRIDLVVSKLQKNKIERGEQISISEESIAVIELKFAKKSDDVQAKLKEGNDQIDKYSLHLKSFTDLGTATKLVAVFDKSTGKITYDADSDVDIPHSSQEMPEIINGLHDISLSSTNKRMTSDELDPNVYGKQDKRARTDSNRQTSRRKRALNYIKNCEHESSISMNNQSIHYKEALLESVQINHLNVISSGSNRLEFWPSHLIKNTWKTVLSIFFSNCSPNLKKDKSPNNLPVTNVIQTESSEKQQLIKSTESQNRLPGLDLYLSVHQPSPFNKPQPEPNVLEMGDQWMKNNHINGLLTWATLLARKWTGYRPKTFESSSYNPPVSIQLDIQSQQLVDAFIDKLEAQVQAFGIEDMAIFDSPTLYAQAIKTVNKKFSRGEIASIPSSLFEQILEQNSSKREELSQLEKQFLEQEASLEEECQEAESDMDYPPSKPDINLLKQEMCSMPLTDHCSDNNNTVPIDNAYNLGNLFAHTIEYGGQYRKCGSL